MKRIMIFVLLLGLVAMSGCTNTTTLPAESSVWAYWTAIETLIDDHPTRLTEDLTYVAFDFSEVAGEDPNTLREIAKEYCKEHGYTFLEGTMDELIDQGYIFTTEISDELTIPGGFEDGVLVSLETMSASETEIVVSASIWKGNLAASGTTYTMTFENGEWTASSDDYWVS